MIIAHVLYDDRRPEKFEPLKAELEKQKLLPVFWEPVQANSVHESINLTQKKIITYAKIGRIPEVLILEDDCQFPADDGFEYFMRNKPESFDIYLGGTYLKHEGEQRSPAFKTNSYVGHHCILVHERYYDTFLSVPATEHIDTAQAGRGEFWVCYPFAAIQRPGYSMNNQSEVNYNLVLTQEDIYYGSSNNKV